jgi:replicative DNA helicase
VKDLILDSEKHYALEEVYKLTNLAQEEPDVDVFGTLSALSIQISEAKLPTTVEQMMTELYDRMAGKEVGISTGIVGLDDCMNGFQNGRLYIVGARSGMGKSAFMCSIVEKMEKKKRIGIISLEMLDKELKQRIACIRAKIPHWKIEKGRCSEEEASEYGQTLLTINNLFINDEGGMKRANVLASIRQMVKKQKCDIVFIDHIGLIRVASNQNLAHEIGENTSALKAIAKELNVPIVGLCQINHSVEAGNEKMPTLSQLRDSGRIEEDADCVILLYREGYYQQQEQEQEPCKYKIAKCRNGKRAIVEGVFTSSLMLFE